MIDQVFCFSGVEVGPELEQETEDIIVSIIGYQIRKTARESRKRLSKCIEADPGSRKRTRAH